jgi:hypothetical protein
MNGVIGMTELLLDTRPDAGATQYADIVRKSGRGAPGCDQQCVGLSKIEAGKVIMSRLRSICGRPSKSRGDARLQWRRRD